MSTQEELDALKKQAVDLYAVATVHATEMELAAVRANMLKEKASILSKSVSDFTLPEVVLPPEPTPSGNKLKWAPPTLSDPVLVTLPTSGGTVNLPAGKDVILRCSAPISAGTVILRGAARHVVMIGGEWDIAQGGRGDNACINVGGGTRTDCPTGIFHAEGVLFRGGGLNEAFDLRCPSTIVQLQNCRIERLVGGSNQGHGDIIQPTSGFKELRVDRMTGGSDYQGLFLRVAYNTPGGPITLRRINLKATAIGVAKLYSFWCEESEAVENTGGTYNTGIIKAEDIWVSAGTTGKSPASLVTMAYPGVTANAPTVSGNKLRWPNKPNRFRTLNGFASGFILAGEPPEGSFVPVGVAGIHYQSPGYEV